MSDATFQAILSAIQSVSPDPTSYTGENEDVILDIALGPDIKNNKKYAFPQRNH